MYLANKILQRGVGSMQGSTEGHLPLKVIFHKASSSTESCIPPKVVFHWRWSSNKSWLPPKVVSHWRLSSTEGRLPPNIAPWLIFYLWEQSIYQISASYLAYKWPYIFFGQTKQTNEINTQSHMLVLLCNTKKSNIFNENFNDSQYLQPQHNPTFSPSSGCKNKK